MQNYRKQYLCKIVDGQAKSIMVFLKQPGPQTSLLTRDITQTNAKGVPGGVR